jgi:RNA polymerase sigma-70 factor (ECF subfamily)
MPSGNFSTCRRHYVIEVDDAGLIERARRGDEDAFSRLFARHQAAIYRYAAHMGGREAADDVVQETFLVVLRQSGRLDPLRGSVIGYLLGIARRLVLKRVTSSSDRDLSEELDNDAMAAPSDRPDALDSLTRTETIEAVRAAVHSLPSTYREVVVLCELQEMDYAAAAQVMQCPIGTVRSRLHRARALLMIKLAVRQPGAAQTRSEHAGLRHR